MGEDLKQKINDCIVVWLEELNLELVELIVRAEGKMIVIEVFADKSHGAITMDECASINKRLNRKIEEEQWIKEIYVVEVSSPGLDRPLKTSQDFLRGAGKRVRFHLSAVVDHKLEHTGVIKDVIGNNVLVDVNLKTVTIPMAQINKAVQVI